MAARKHKGQADWRRNINQHETFDHDSLDSLFYDWDRIGDPDAPPRSPLKFYVPRTTDDVVRCVQECARLGQTLIVRSKGHSSNDLVTPPGGAVMLTEKLTGVLEIDDEELTATSTPAPPPPTSMSTSPDAASGCPSSATMRTSPSAGSSPWAASPRRRSATACSWTSSAASSTSIGPGRSTRWTGRRDRTGFTGSRRASVATASSPS